MAIYKTCILTRPGNLLIGNESNNEIGDKVRNLDEDPRLFDSDNEGLEPLLKSNNSSTSVDIQREGNCLDVVNLKKNYPSVRIAVVEDATIKKVAIEAINIKLKNIKDISDTFIAHSDQEQKLDTEHFILNKLMDGGKIG